MRPENLCDTQVLSDLGLKTGTPTSFWELCAGSATLSARGRKTQLSHLPPIDYRWGHNLGKARDQLKILWPLLFVGTKSLFVSPGCSPWGDTITILVGETARSRA